MTSKFLCPSWSSVTGETSSLIGGRVPASGYFESSFNGTSDSVSPGASAASPLFGDAAIFSASYGVRLSKFSLLRLVRDRLTAVVTVGGAPGVDPDTGVFAFFAFYGGAASC